MPQLLEFIDKIARDKGRDVLYVTFDVSKQTTQNPERWAVRKELMAWLDTNDIGYQRCGNVAQLAMMESYEGQLYIDVPFDESDPQYIKVRDHLEYSDAVPKIEGVYFWVLPLEDAMRNKHHDEPGFWEDWGDNF
ncbi:hypothetical protein [Psychrobacter sp. I-STPA10]|uniref:hypothetical protein n=1 Tax=Psychrobacter sp. I-STPA10 TaxID=2585769 RepID=UPI001E37E916|nr:hypothetical protein [Psychrobacter sp. I-STPA10]